ncbi:MAG: hypothetical protein ACK4G4_11085 [Thermus sp.]
MGFWLAPLLREEALVQAALTFLLPRLGQELKPEVGWIFLFSEAKAALQVLLDRGHVGKVVIRL